MNAQEKIEFAMYGMTAAELREEIESSLYVKIMNDVDMLVMSMLSDAQQMVEFSTSEKMMEEQRQLINRAKFALRYYVMNKEVA